MTPTKSIILLLILGISTSDAAFFQKKNKQHGEVHHVKKSPRRKLFCNKKCKLQRQQQQADEQREEEQQKHGQRYYSSYSTTAAMGILMALGTWYLQEVEVSKWEGTSVKTVQLDKINEDDNVTCATSQSDEDEESGSDESVETTVSPVSTPARHSSVVVAPPVVEEVNSISNRPTPKRAATMPAVIPCKPGRGYNEFLSFCHSSTSIDN